MKIPVTDPIKGPLKGVDVSHYDGNIDWDKVKASGVVFAIIKSSEGLDRDLQFQTNWEEAKRVGIIRGAYHFFHPSIDPVSQAEFFTSIVEPLDNGDLPLSLDWETTDGLSAFANNSAAKSFLETIQDASKKTPMIYCSVDWIPDLGADPAFAAYAPWIADYNFMPPRIPEPWTKPIQFVQYTGSGTSPGMQSPGNSDLDLFLGSLEELKTFILNSKVR